jgi:serine/threonine protein kinase
MGGSASKERKEIESGTGVVVGTELGKGAFGIVYKGTTKKDGKVCAIKVMNKARLVQDEMEQGEPGRTKAQVEAFVAGEVAKEVEIMNRVKGCPYVIEVYANASTKNNYIIVSQLAQGGDLMTRIERLSTTPGSHFSEHICAGWMKQMLKGISACHDRLVVHR